MPRVNQTVEPVSRFQKFIYPKVRRRGHESSGPLAAVPPGVEGVEVGEVSGRESTADEQCVLDAFPLCFDGEQEGNDPHGAPGTAVQDQTAPIVLDETGFDKHCLTLSQQHFAEAVRDWCQAPRKMLLVVSGGPGTGKSYFVREVLKHVQAKQLRMSYTGSSTRAIDGSTIHSTLNLAWGKGSLTAALEGQLKDETNLQKCIEQSAEMVNEFTYQGNPRVVVVDEVSMINGWLMYWLVRFFMDRTRLPLLFIAMGDRHQLHPVKSSHNLFSVTDWGEGIHVVKMVLKESKRFTPAYGKLINQLRGHVDANDAEGFFKLVQTHFPVVDAIDGPMLAQVNRAMAFRNDRVQKFNQYYIKNMVHGPEVQLKDLVLKKGCLVLVTKNAYAVKNGTLLQFQQYNAEKKCVVCTYPNSRKVVTITGDEQGKFALEIGFASTIHKFQGSTIDDAKIVIHFDNNVDLNMAYTALSRVRELKQILAISGIQEREEEKSECDF